jgi:hypothetical protein
MHHGDMDEHGPDIDGDHEQIGRDARHLAAAPTATSRSGLPFPLPLAPRADGWWPFAG